MRGASHIVTGTIMLITLLLSENLAASALQEEEHA